MTTGSTKKTAMTASAGAASAQPTTPVRVIADGRPLRPGKEPAALLEQGVDPGVELRRRFVDVLLACDHALGGELHGLEDTLPLGDLRRGAHALELVERTPATARRRERGARQALGAAAGRR